MRNKNLAEPNLAGLILRSLGSGSSPPSDMLQWTSSLQLFLFLEIPNIIIGFLDSTLRGPPRMSSA